MNNLQATYFCDDLNEKSIHCIDFHTKENFKSGNFDEPIRTVFFDYDELNAIRNLFPKLDMNEIKSF